MMQCLSCAYENPEAQKFCGNCGAPLSPAAAAEHLPLPASYTPPHLAHRILTLRSALEGERKLVTVLFCDIANSTPLAARLGAEAMHALLNRFFELALAEVHGYDGTINQFLGDGFMALFGAPVAHEDHARRALLAAVGLQQRLRDPAGEAATLRDIRVRIGVNTGMVVVGTIGDNLRMDYTAVGDTTNLAARLQSLAAPGTIRISEATHRAALPYFEFTALGKQTLKGIAEPVEVYDVRQVRAAGAGGRYTAPTDIRSPLVGRDRELSLLAASLETLRQGRGGVVILQGEPGLGKSRLIAEARRQSGAEGVRWLEGRALSFGRRLSYWPFIEILKHCFGIADTDAEAQAWRKLEQAAHALFEARAPEIVPYVATVLALEMTGEYEPRVQYLDAQALGRQVFLSMRHLFERLALLRQGIAAVRATGAALSVPYLCTMLADVAEHLGHTDDGLQALAEAHTLVEQHEERYWEAEICRLRGVVLLRQTMPPQEEAETWLRRALDVARRQEAKALELRAAMSLARLWQQQGKHAEAHELLAPVYGWFTEGFDTADLQEAKALLEELS
jgi:class 3 adenylate cyclase